MLRSPARSSPSQAHTRRSYTYAMDHVDPGQVPARRQLRSDLVSALHSSSYFTSWRLAPLVSRVLAGSSVDPHRRHQRQRVKPCEF